jgi:hypothetical protein
MDPILQPLAILLASLLGLVGTPDLKLVCDLHQVSQSVAVHAQVVGAVTEPVSEFVMAGNPLTLVFSFRSGDTEQSVAETIRYQAWDRQFQVFTDENPTPVVYKDALRAFAAWTSVEVTTSRALPFSAKAFLKSFDAGTTSGDIAVLWGYKIVEYHR